MRIAVSGTRVPTSNMLAEARQGGLRKNTLSRAVSAKGRKKSRASARTTSPIAWKALSDRAPRVGHDAGSAAVSSAPKAGTSRLRNATASRGSPVLPLVGGGLTISLIRVAATPVGAVIAEVSATSSHPETVITSRSKAVLAVPSARVEDIGARAMRRLTALTRLRRECAVVVLAIKMKPEQDPFLLAGAERRDRRLRGRAWRRAGPAADPRGDLGRPVGHRDADQRAVVDLDRHRSDAQDGAPDRPFAGMALLRHVSELVCEQSGARAGLRSEFARSEGDGAAAGEGPGADRETGAGGRFARVNPHIREAPAEARLEIAALLGKSGASRHG